MGPLRADAHGPTMAGSLVLAVLMVTTGSRVAQLGFPTIAVLLLVAAAAHLAILLQGHPGGPWHLASESPLSVHDERVIRVALGLHVALQAVYVFEHAGPGLAGLAAIGAFLVFGIVTVDAIRVRPWLGSWSSAGTAVAFLLFGLTWIAVRAASTDVLVWQEVGLDRLLHGVDPYVRGYPNIYPAEAAARFYAPGLVDGGIVMIGYPYPPLTLGLALPGWLLGDVRVSHALALAIAGFMLTRCGRAGRIGACLVWTNPSAPFAIENGVTETFVVLALVLVITSWEGGDRRLGVLIGLLLVSKQYAILLTLPLWWAARRWGRDRRSTVLRWIVLSASVTTLPLAMWNVAEFWFSVVELQFRQPFRDDAVSLLVVVVNLVSWPPLRAFTGILVAGIVTGGLWAWRQVGDRDLDVQLTAGAFLTLIFFLLSKQAFLNYYFLTACVLAIAFACGAPGRFDQHGSPADVDTRMAG